MYPVLKGIKMKKLYSINYHFSGSEESAGDMMCRACRNKIDCYTDDWLDAKRNYGKDWGFVTYHRKCFSEQLGWQKIEKKK